MAREAPTATLKYAPWNAPTRGGFLHTGACCNCIKRYLNVFFGVFLHDVIKNVYAKFEEKKKIPREENAFYVQVWA
jgi:hypothetical protein